MNRLIIDAKQSFSISVDHSSHGRDFGFAHSKYLFGRIAR
jgi:hypothetical protein